jgi:uncharacterized protein (TIGR03435 family)
MRDRLSFLATAFALLALGPSAAPAQELDIVPSGPMRLTFDVISIRPAKGPGNFCNSQPNPGGDGYQARCMPLKSMIAFIYKVSENKIAGIPAGLADESFDIDAKTEKVYSLSELRTMFQNMLVDRFGLRFHTEKRVGNVYALTIDKSGLKMKPNNDPEDLQPQFRGRPSALIGTRVPMNRLCWELALLSRSDERPVVNMTGLTGNYDFTLDYLPELPPGVDKDKLPPGYLDRPDLFTAVREQLGLKLTAQKGPVTYMVVDHVERPSEN